MTVSADCAQAGPLGPRASGGAATPTAWTAAFCWFARADRGRRHRACALCAPHRPARSRLFRPRGDLLDDSRSPTVFSRRPHHPTNPHRLALICPTAFTHLPCPYRALFAPSLFRSFSPSPPSPRSAPSAPRRPPPTPPDRSPAGSWPLAPIVFWNVSASPSKAPRSKPSPMPRAPTASRASPSARRG